MKHHFQVIFKNHINYEAKKDSFYSPDLALLNKYLEVIIKTLKPKIFNEKDAVLFYEITKLKKNQLSN